MQSNCVSKYFSAYTNYHCNWFWNKLRSKNYFIMYLIFQFSIPTKNIEYIHKEFIHFQGGLIVVRNRHEETGLKFFIKFQLYTRTNEFEKTYRTSKNNIPKLQHEFRVHPTSVSLWRLKRENPSFKENQKDVANMAYIK